MEEQPKAPTKTSINRWLIKNKENADLNQYWYSKITIDFLVNEVTSQSTCCAFLSTPSIYFSLDASAELRKNSSVFDFDKKFGSDPNFVFYDFNHPENIPEEHKQRYDLILIDPPFITREVWTKYTEAALFLVKEGGKILASTIDENEAMMKELLNTDRKKFRPSIPNLVYQYSMYANYESEGLDKINPEIPELD